MGRGFLDVLRSTAQLSILNANDLREELKSLRRRRGKAEEGVVLQELSSLAMFLNDMVVSVGVDDGSEEAHQAGGGAVAVEPFNLKRVFNTAAHSELLAGGVAADQAAAGLPHLACSSSSTIDQQQQQKQYQQQGGHAVQYCPAAASSLFVTSSSSSSSTISSSSSSAPSPKAPPAPSVPASSIVLGNQALLHYIYDFLVEGRAESRGQLGDLSLVCRQWKELSYSQRYWRPIAAELFPRLSSAAVSDDTEDEEGGGAGNGEEGMGSGSSGNGGGGGSSSDPHHHHPEWHRKYVVQYGRCLTEQPIRMGPWHEGISLSFDLHDEQDGLRLFSSTGPIRFTGTTIPGITAMKLTGRRRRITTPFSASSRDPGGNFASIEELFQEGDQPEYPVSLTVRVTARDERTGRMALLFSSNKRSKRWVENLGVDMGVPEGTLLVNQGWNRVQLPSSDKGGGSDLVMQMLTVFYVAPVEEQDSAVDPADRLYSVLTLDCAFMLQCKTEDQEAIGRFILAALRQGPALEMEEETSQQQRRRN